MLKSPYRHTEEARVKMAASIKASWDRRKAENDATLQAQFDGLKLGRLARGQPR